MSSLNELVKQVIEYELFIAILQFALDFHYI